MILEDRVKIGILGFAAGLINGLLGIGGGTIIIPGLVALVGLAQHQAHGTSLAIILPTALISSLLYGLNKSMNLGLAAQVALSGMIGGYLGARLMSMIPAHSLRRLFGIFMALAGLRMVI
ncbi:MAG: TSUP family transporter [Clostridia bacterium]|nr:TSUP family transporter [Clostridia bacterium]